jgi:hypothetical protein
MADNVSPSDQAALNHAMSGVMPDTPGSSTQPCPYMKRLRLGVFFDGTGNNKYNDQPTGHHTNVVRLLDPYKDTSDDLIIRDKFYLIGVGAGGPPQKLVKKGWIWNTYAVDDSQRWATQQSDVGTGTAGKLFGKGMKDRINKAYTWVQQKVQEHSANYTKESEKLIDVYGFSRGAAASRTFVNLVNQALKKKDFAQNTEVRMLGIFDTVASTGAPGLSVGLNLGLDSGDYRSCLHPTARDETRDFFPLSRLPGADHDYAGVHSDVGGGYGAGTSGDEGKSNWLAGVPCWDVYQRSKATGVEFTQDPKLPDVFSQMGPGDVEPLRTTSNRLDGTEKGTAAGREWQGHYVHISTSFFQQAHTVKDYSVITPDGMPLDTGIVKREELNEPKYTLASDPPNFSWK